MEEVPPGSGVGSMVRSRLDRAKAAVDKLRAAEQQSRAASTRREKVEAAIAKIRAFYELGQNLPPKGKHRDAYRQRIMETEQERLGVNADTLRKAREFVDGEKRYTQEEVEQLCRLIHDVQTRQDEDLAAFERSHLVRMLSVPRNRRKAFQRECIEMGWSLARLEKEIAARFGTRKEGGRLREVPDDMPALLAQVEAMCERWRRWHRRLPKGNTAFPRGLRPSVEKVCAEVLSLQRAVLKALKRLQPDREDRDLSEVDADDGGRKAAGRQQRKR